MTDPRRVWNEASAQSKQGVVRKFWPELAAALDGTAGGGDSDTPADEQPPCRNCGHASGRLAIGRAGDIPVCGRCAGLAEFRAMKLIRVTQWQAGRRS